MKVTLGCVLLLLLLHASPQETQKPTEEKPPTESKSTSETAKQANPVKATPSSIASGRKSYPLRSENTRVQIIREIMVATTMSSLLSVPDVHLGNTDERPRPIASISFRRRSNFTLTTALLPDVDHRAIWRDVLPPTSRTSNSAMRIPETSRTSEHRREPSGFEAVLRIDGLGRPVVQHYRGAQ
jgi:hypothetical protein